jgi:hypothetical protein
MAAYHDFGDGNLFEAAAAIGGDTMIHIEKGPISEASFLRLSEEEKKKVVGQKHRSIFSKYANPSH